MLLPAPSDQGSAAYAEDEEVAREEGDDDDMRRQALRLEGGDHAGQVVVDAEEEHGVAEDGHELLRLQGMLCYDVSYRSIRTRNILYYIISHYTILYYTTLHYTTIPCRIVI